MITKQTLSVLAPPQQAEGYHKVNKLELKFYLFCSTKNDRKHSNTRKLRTQSSTEEAHQALFAATNIISNYDNCYYN